MVSKVSSGGARGGKGIGKGIGGKSDRDKPDGVDDIIQAGTGGVNLTSDGKQHASAAVSLDANLALFALMFVLLLRTMHVLGRG